MGIYEYTPGFLHSKNFVSDDLYGTVGSINMDYRSLFLHFENGVLLFGTDAVAGLRSDFFGTLYDCRPVTLAESTELPVVRRVLRAILKVFAPLM